MILSKSLKIIRKNIKNSIFHLSSNGNNPKSILENLISVFPNPMFNKKQIKNTTEYNHGVLNRQQRLFTHDRRKTKSISKICLILIRVNLSNLFLIYTLILIFHLALNRSKWWFYYRKGAIS